MRLEIVASDGIEKKTLIVYDEGISYNESAAFGLGPQHRHWFRDIDAVLRSIANPALPILSIQVGRTIYNIRYKANDGQHRAAVDFLVQKTKEAHQQ